MEELAINTNIDNMAIWQGMVKMARLNQYTNTKVCEITTEKGHDGMRG